MIIHPHDLIWIDDKASLLTDVELPDWVIQHWQVSLPVVVRRDKLEAEFIPVGIRGCNRSQRLAAKIKQSHIVNVVTPESLVANMQVDGIHAPIKQSLYLLKQYPFSWTWGITGSCGYQLATGVNVLTNQSDLDLLIRCPTPAVMDQLVDLACFIKGLPCLIDVQVETPYGGFALNEWIRDKKVLLKTATGPVITNNPWLL